MKLYGLFGAVMAGSAVCAVSGIAVMVSLVVR